jgi:molecular chaperone Hsp33
MAVTVDHGPSAHRYQGITELTGPRLADCAHHYFRQSEPLETAISLAATHRKQGPARSAALMIQRLTPEDMGPEPASDDAEDDWRKAVVLTSSATVGEMLDPQLRPAHLLYRLYHEDGVRLFRTRSLRQGCRCSEDKVAKTLAAFTAQDLDTMVVDGKIIVTCEFCKKTYAFDRADLDIEKSP